MEYKFHIGQHVVCINDKWVCRRTGKPASDFGILAPKLNKVYTIRGKRMSKPGPYEDHLVLLFEELDNSSKSNPETGFVARHFKPLQKLTTDMFMKENLNV